MAAAVPTVEEVVTFLRTRVIAVEICERFSLEKMDGAAVTFASDSALQELGIKAKGDLFALKAFCEGKCNAKVSEKESLKKKLLDQLLSKRKKKKSGILGSGSPNSGKETKVKTRKLQLGWLHYKPEKGRYVMVRTKDGGGTRDVDLPSDSTKDDILEYVVGIFFEGGSSKFGAEQSMEFDLGNFKCEKVLDVTNEDGSIDPFTLSGYFLKCKLNKARLYLMSKQLVNDSKRPRTDSDDDEDLLKDTFSTVENEKDKNTRNLAILQTARAQRVPQEPAPSTSSNGDYVTVTVQDSVGRFFSRQFLKTEQVMVVYDWIGATQMIEWFVLYLKDKEDHILPTQPITVLENKIVHMAECSNAVPLSEDTEVTFQGFDVASQPEMGGALPSSPVPLFEVSDKPPVNFMDSTSSDSDVDPTSSDSERMPSPTNSVREPRQPTERRMSLEQRARQWRASLQPQTNCELPNDHVEDLRQKLYLELASDKPIQVSRPSVFEDLLKYYEDDTMADSTIQVTFNNEKGQDYGGLTQDVFSAFWEQAFQKFFDGEVVKVPFVAPSELHQVRGTFEAMGRIFSHGFIITSAIPVRFCQSSIVGAFLGSQNVPETVLLRDLLSHVSEREAKVMSCCMSAKEKEEVTEEQEDVMFSVFSRFEMRSAPVWGTHLKEQLIELARFIFVLRPLCLLEWMVSGIPQDHLNELWYKLNPSDYESLYEALHPTADRVLKSLQTAVVLKPEEEVAFYYLKDFVANLEQERLERFLRFVTGRPSASLGPIHVSFNRSEGLARTPKASTCTNCLVLSVCYPSLSEFKREFNNVLSSDDAFEMHSV